MTERTRRANPLYRKETFLARSNSGAKPLGSTPHAGFEQVSPARALRDDELPALIDDYRLAARNAMAAGLNDIEIHAANCYLFEQFLRDSVNERGGPYGGSI